MIDSVSCLNIVDETTYNATKNGIPVSKFKGKLCSSAGLVIPTLGQFIDLIETSNKMVQAL